MPESIKRWLPLAGLVLMLAGLLVLVITGTVGELIVVPLLYLFWIARLLFLSIPQLLIWVGLVGVTLFVAGQHLPLRAPQQQAAAAPTLAAGRVAAWARLSNLAEHDSYSRWRLAQRLSQLVVEVLAEQAQCPPQQIVQRLKDGGLEIAPELGAYLRAGLASYTPPSPFARLRRALARGLGLRAAATATPLDLDGELVIQYFEQAIQHSGDTR